MTYTAGGAPCSTHMEPRHFAVALQTLPQTPQLFASFVVSTQLAPHLTVLPVQLPAQLPLSQTWLLAHTVPHLPQLFGSCMVATHMVPQSTVPVPQVLPPLELELEPPVPLVSPPPPQAAADAPTNETTARLRVSFK